MAIADATERELTAQWIAKFEEAAARPIDEADLMARVQRDALRSQLADLRADLAEYDARHPPLPSP